MVSYVLALDPLHLQHLQLARQPGHKKAQLCNSCYTFLVVDPLAPERLYVRSTDETSIEFGWKGPLLLNGELENFMLTYSPPDSCRGNGGDIVMSNDILTDADVTEMQVWRKMCEVSIVFA